MVNDTSYINLGCYLGSGSKHSKGISHSSKDKLEPVYKLASREFGIFCFDLSELCQLTFSMKTGEVHMGLIVS